MHSAAERMQVNQYPSRSQAARLLGCSAELVRQLAKAGRLPALTTPNGRIYHRRDVARLAAQRADRGPRDPLPAA